MIDTERNKKQSTSDTKSWGGDIPVGNTREDGRKPPAKWKKKDDNDNNRIQETINKRK